MQLNKVNTILEYDFLLKHKTLKEYYENYFKYKNDLTNKYNLYTLMYINGKYPDFAEIQTYLLNNNDELYMYLGIDKKGLNHVFICINLSINLAYNEFYIDDNDIQNKNNKNRFIINKVNVPDETYKKYIKCLTDTYEIVGY